MSAVQARPMSRQAVAYGFREIARRAGVRAVPGGATGFEEIGIDCLYGQPSEARRNGPTLVVIPSDPAEWTRLLTLPPNTLPRIPGRDAAPAGSAPVFPRDVPILLRGSGPEAKAGFARVEGRTLILDCDVVAAAVLQQSRWEEGVIAARDEHGRMPAEESVAFRQGFLDRPLIDEYALLLRRWLREIAPGWSPSPGRFTVRLSHDIDVVRPFHSAAAGIRTAAGDLLKRGSPSSASRSLWRTAAQTLAPRRTSAYRGLFRLAEISKRYGLRGAFFVMAASYTGRDSGYDPGAPEIRDALRRLEDDGFEIGFHPSYRTHDDPNLLSEEKARLDEVLGRTRYGGRQHFLRFEAPETWRRWERLGLTYDSTLTFAGSEGFRCSTCHPYRPFDLVNDRELELQEVPLIVMDGTLRQYRNLTPPQAESRVLELLERCRAAEGTFTMLWHNSSLDGDWEGWESVYERVVAEASRVAAETPVSLPASPIDSEREFASVRERRR